MTIREHLQRRLTLFNIAKYGGALAALTFMWPYVLPRKQWLAVAWIIGVLVIVAVTDALLKNKLLRCPRCDAQVAQRSPRGRVAIPASCPKCAANFDEPYA
jgi:hypothetical protein